MWYVSTENTRVHAVHVSVLIQIRICALQKSTNKLIHVFHMTASDSYQMLPFFGNVI